MKQDAASGGSKVDARRSGTAGAARSVGKIDARATRWHAASGGGTDAASTEEVKQGETVLPEASHLQQQLAEEQQTHRQEIAARDMQLMQLEAILQLEQEEIAARESRMGELETQWLLDQRDLTAPKQEQELAARMEEEATAAEITEDRAVASMNLELTALAGELDTIKTETAAQVASHASALEGLRLQLASKSERGRKRDRAAPQCADAGGTGEC